MIVMYKVGLIFILVKIILIRCLFILGLEIFNYFFGKIKDCCKLR